MSAQQEGLGLEAMIPVINKLQDVFSAVGGEQIDLPQIVVVGSQSSGKSSVLESVVGKSFLPRGSGIVTRRPLVLQLVHIQPNPKAQHQEWGEFLHKPKEMFYDFDQIRREIEMETDRLTGRNKGISPNPIRLRVFSPNVLNLTVVDLPGITRVPVGDQPADIEVQIRKMVLTYIERRTTIILAVTAANTDIANSDALQMAREVDPEGLRTIGVITKIDIMDKGTDALDMLLGRVIPLKLGFVGVVNRSQADINANKTIHSARKAEADFFQAHPLYRTIAARCGTPFLSKQLNRILMNHIRDSLPELKARINKMMGEAQAELETYGDPMYDSKKSQGALLLQILTRFSTDYKDCIDGKLNELSVNELYGGARINFIFTETFQKCLKAIHPNNCVEDIRTAIKNATGPRAALFVPEVSFEMLVKRQIARLEDPALECVELVYDELHRIVSQLESKELLRFNALREQVVQVVHDLLHKCKVPTRKMISNLIQIELAYVNTNHPDFVGGGGAMGKIFEKMARAQQEEKMANAQQQMQQQQAQMQQQNPQGRGPQQPGRTGQQQRPGGQQHPQQQQQQQQQMGQGQQGQQGGFFGKFFGGSGNPNNPHQQQAPVQPQRPQQQQQQFNQQRSMQSSAVTEYARMEQVPVSIKAGAAVTDKEKFETELIQNLLSSYFDIVRKNILDSIPKAIMYFLVNSSKDSIQHELVRNLYKEELFDELLEESPVIAQRRKACRQLLDVLRKANDILTEVRDFNPTSRR